MNDAQRQAVERLTLLANGCGVSGLDHLPVVSRGNATEFAADLRTLLALVADRPEVGVEELAASWRSLADNNMQYVASGRASPSEADWAKATSVALRSCADALDRLNASPVRS